MASAPSPTRQLDMSHLPRPCYSDLSRQTHCTATRPHAGVTDARRPLPRASEGLLLGPERSSGAPGLLQAPPITSSNLPRPLLSGSTASQQPICLARLQDGRCLGVSPEGPWQAG